MDASLTKVRLAQVADVLAAMAETAARSSDSPSLSITSVLQESVAGRPAAWSSLLANAAASTAASAVAADLELIATHGPPNAGLGACPPIIQQSRH